MKDTDSKNVNDVQVPVLDLRRMRLQAGDEVLFQPLGRTVKITSVIMPERGKSGKITLVVEQELPFPERPDLTPFVALGDLLKVPPSSQAVGFREPDRDEFDRVRAALGERKQRAS